MVKRILAPVCIAISIFCFSSCKKVLPRPVNPDAVLMLALRSGTYSNVIKKCLRNFEHDNNVLCDVLELSEDELHSKVAQNASESEGLYDFCMVDGSWMAEYTAHGVLAELSQFGYELDDDIIPATKAICYQNGGLYLAPYYGNVTVLLYNKLIVKEAGFTPEEINTIEDIQKICRFSKSRHNLGFMYRGDTPNNVVVDFLPILLSCGGWVVDENNFPTVNTPEFKSAMETYLAMISTGRAAKKEDLIAAIANKSAAVGIGWPGWYTPTRNSSMDYVALTGRYKPGLSANNANIYGIWAVGIPANSKHKEYSVKLLKYLMDAQVQKDTVIFGGVPCRYSSLSDPEILKTFPQYEAVRKALESGVYRPTIEEWTQFYTILGKEMKLVISGEKWLDFALSDAQQQLEELMSHRNSQMDAE